jgi:hypothetical protein
MYSIPFLQPPYVMFSKESPPLNISSVVNFWQLFVEELLDILSGCALFNPIPGTNITTMGLVYEGWKSDKICANFR